MQIEWYGQSAFRLKAPEATVFIDPFAGVPSLAQERGIQFDYPPITDVSADLVLVTHEHFDHNGVEAVGGSPQVLRSTAGRLSSEPIDEVLAVASEHDAAAGTERGPNTIFAFTLEGLRVAHFGDFGQTELRPEQAAALGQLDMVFLPVGAGPTIGPEQAQAICASLRPRWVVPMHLEAPAFDTDSLPAGDGTLAVVPAVP
jgi:L-ascorbate metabolism protein UlaG (beta-lactamase superfamily)